MAEPERPPSHYERGLASGFDDAWHEEWWRLMDEQGGNIIAAMRMRMVSSSDDGVVMEMSISPGVRQGTGVFAAGALIQLADVAATSACFDAMHKADPTPSSCRSRSPSRSAPASSATQTAAKSSPSHASSTPAAR